MISLRVYASAHSLVFIYSGIVKLLSPVFYPFLIIFVTFYYHVGKHQEVNFFFLRWSQVQGQEQSYWCWSKQKRLETVQALEKSHRLFGI